MPLVLLERSWWARFNGIYLVRFGFRMWEILIFKWFLLLKIQINSKKPGFGRKNQLITWVTLEGLSFNSSNDFLSYLAVQKIDTYIANQCSHVEFPYFVMGSHLGQQHRPHWKLLNMQEINYEILWTYILKSFSHLFLLYIFFSLGKLCII